jgi:hypothetical protein
MRSSSALRATSNLAQLYTTEPNCLVFTYTMRQAMSRPKYRLYRVPDCSLLESGEAAVPTSLQSYPSPRYI